VAEGARLESVFRGNSNVGSNPTLSAMLLKLHNLSEVGKIPKPTLRPCFRLWNERHAVLQGHGCDLLRLTRLEKNLKSADEGSQLGALDQK
jgi:hypothetical protein